MVRASILSRIPLGLPSPPKKEIINKTLIEIEAFQKEEVQMFHLSSIICVIFHDSLEKLSFAFQICSIICYIPTSIVVGSISEIFIGAPYFQR